MQYNSEELYLLLLIPSAVKTVLSISQNGIDQITSNKQIDNHLNEDIINASNEVVKACQGQTLNLICSLKISYSVRI
jgi:hypothetical protein